jgi:hypothetical protein
MATKHKKKIGTILKAGPQVQAKPLVGPAIPYKTYGDARRFFLTQGSNGRPRPGQVSPGGTSVVFEGDYPRTGMQDVFVTWMEEGRVSGVGGGLTD